MEAAGFEERRTETVAALRAGRRLEYLTIAWNGVEGVVSIVAGMFAGSTALIGFGVDSAIESTSGAALLWRLNDEQTGEAREEIALKLVGASFLLLALWICFDAIVGLRNQEAPDVSVVGIVVAALSLIVMPWLAWRKRRVARVLVSRALAADARQTTICAYLSAILLAGLGLNALFGWWWADPVAALLMAPLIVREGVEALRGERGDDDAVADGARPTAGRRLTPRGSTEHRSPED